MVRAMSAQQIYSSGMTPEFNHTRPDTKVGARTVGAESLLLLVRVTENGVDRQLSPEKRDPSKGLVETRKRVRPF